MKIGVLSDTHDHLDPKVREHFEGVDHILHAGDIGLPALLLDLEQIAPVTAVAGNADFTGRLQEVAVVTLQGRRFLLVHQLDPRAPPEPLRRRLIREPPDVVIFGHTHQPFCETIGGTLYLNPGYAGSKRGTLRCTVALLHCEPEAVRVEFRDL